MEELRRLVSHLQTPEAHAAAWNIFKSAECILVPGGFGDRGVSGMVLAAKYARENKIPYLGICLGMQIAVIEFARSVLGLERANSTEFDAQTSDPVVIFMPEVWLKNTYGKHNETWIPKNTFTEPRLSHFKAVNPEVAQALEEAGLRFVGKDDTGKRVEASLEKHFVSYGQRAVLKFAQYTGANAIAGRHTPGTFTNQMQTSFSEPRLLIKLTTSVCFGCETCR
ncbi:hypothetical protein ARALYDRAFT_352427 [Arabidopsis lyrata subsp. lyrata]|uniref:CTP synthase (glutamine hydrolyzing) n=1 Tax=Arabidopsis lyrata subsp. lyrata TaxID=81972 RepID=D7M1Y0_ARALL|nr:hypothetical protein ARALYDRAFT_352427 [Arabidopsis lyrata subsp. lyrata]